MSFLRRGAVSLLAVLAITADVVAQAPEPGALRYSVLVASMNTFEEAREVAQQWDSPSLPYYIVPVQVNRQVYYRVLAGMFEDRGDAVSVMNQLVEQGIKETSNDWHVRETGLVYALGSFDEAAEGRSTVARAVGRGVPAYMLVTEDGEGPKFAVYAGGFESRAEADYLGRKLSQDGLGSELVDRVGVDAKSVADFLNAVGMDPDPSGAAPVPAVPPADEPPPEVTGATEDARRAIEEASPPVIDSGVPTDLVRSGQDVLEDVRDSTVAAHPDPPIDPPDESRAGAAEGTPDGVLSGSLPPRPLPPVPQVPDLGFGLAIAAHGGATPGRNALHGYGGLLIHPHWSRVGVLASGAYGTGAGYDSMAGFGALTFLLGRSGPLGVWALGGYGYYEETGVLDENRSATVPTAGGMITYDLGGVQLIGAYTGMFGTYEEQGLSIDLRVWRGSIGIGMALGGSGS